MLTFCIKPTLSALYLQNSLCSWVMLVFLIVCPNLEHSFLPSLLSLPLRVFNWDFWWYLVCCSFGVNLRSSTLVVNRASSCSVLVLAMIRSRELSEMGMRGYSLRKNFRKCWAMRIASLEMIAVDKLFVQDRLIEKSWSTSLAVKCKERLIWEGSSALTNTFLGWWPRWEKQKSWNLTSSYISMKWCPIWSTFGVIRSSKKSIFESVAASTMVFAQLSLSSHYIWTSTMMLLSKRFINLIEVFLVSTLCIYYHQLWTSKKLPAL